MKERRDLPAFPPPLLLFAAALAAGLWLSSRFPTPYGAEPVTHIAGWALIACALAIGAPAVATILLSKTTIMPHRHATRLVTGGPYRLTRNPMYVLLTLGYIGVAILYHSLWSLLLLVPVLLYMDLRVIRAEERDLERIFGAEYIRYRQTVRRWI